MTNGKTTAAGGSLGRELPKAKTGIHGFDEVSFGGLPRGRTTLLAGGPGCGKTLFATEFLVRGAAEMGEPGAFVSFEETSDALVANVASLGMDLERLIAEKKLAIDHVRVERKDLVEAGEYDLEGLFIRLGYLIDTIGAKRVVLDTIESLFSALANEAILRAELRRLFGWLADRGVTSVVTGERGEGTLTRHGLEEYVSDCVVLLDQRVEDRITTRFLRIVKYRGSRHGSNEYPFLIHERGISVLPITSLSLDYPASNERISTGIPRLDTMLGGKGLYRGSTVLISGSAGSGKSTLAAFAAHASVRAGERCLYFAFEESRRQIIRNMRSIGLDLMPACDAGLLRFVAARPTAFGLEMHLVAMQREIETFDPKLVVVDPISNLEVIAPSTEVRGMLTRLVDLLKSRQTTSIFVSLTHGNMPKESTEVGVSSLMDTWLLLQFVEQNNERNRLFYVLKSRGMPHSNQVREFVFTEGGIDLANVYIGPAGGLVVGAARRTQEARDEAASNARTQRVERLRRNLAGKGQTRDERISALRAHFEMEEDKLLGRIDEELRSGEVESRDRNIMAGVRRADAAAPNATHGSVVPRKTRGGGDG